jgi:hypothetical protein
MKNSQRDRIKKIYNQINKIAVMGRDNYLEYYKLVDELIKKGFYDYYEQCLLIKYNLPINKYKSVLEVKTATWKKILAETKSSQSVKLNILLTDSQVYQNGHNVYSDNINYVYCTYSGPFNSETYSRVATQSRISLSKNDSDIILNLLDNHIYRVDIDRVIWATHSSSPVNEIPRELNQLFGINSGTYSYLGNLSLTSSIPTTMGGDYMITTWSRDPYYKWVYKVKINKDNFLGTIKEVDSYVQETKYYQQDTEYAKLQGLKKTFLEINKIGATQSVVVIKDDPTLSEDANLLNRYKIAINYLLS